MTNALPTPPDVPAPRTVPDPEPLHLANGLWHSREPRWPTPATVVALIAAVLSILSLVGVRFELNLPVVGRGDIDLDTGLWPQLRILLVAVLAATVWFTRLFTTGGRGLQLVALVVTVPGILMGALLVSVVIFLLIAYAFTGALFVLMFAILAVVLIFLARGAFN